MRRVPAAVTVVTACAGTRVRGMTVGSFTSVSLDPLLVSFNVGKASSMYPVLMRADHFYVHLLSEDQVEMSNHFAKPDLTDEEQFANVTYREAPDGAPILTETLAYLRCEKIVVYDAGDHSLMLGRIEDIVRMRDGLPLIYFDRGYRGIGSELDIPEAAEVTSEE